MTHLPQRARLTAACLAALLALPAMTGQAQQSTEPAGQLGPEVQPLSADGAVPQPAMPSTPQASVEGPEPFGANLFQGNFLRTREDGLNPDYVVMPGDRVAVQTWGAIQLSSVLTVDGQGNLFLPEIGPIQVAGVRNADLTDVVKKNIGRVYLRHFGVYTNLLSAKPVAVMVTGGVARPGSYAGVPSDSILFFLDQAGGIDPALGSYRRIQVLRDGEILSEVDLYAFLLRGELGATQFKDGDTIFVQRRGPRVELRGNVAKPALIELPSEPATGANALAVVPKAASATEVTIKGTRAGAPYQQTLSTEAFVGARLFDGDVVELREDGHSSTILVRIEGEFSGPSVLSVKRGARLVDVLNHIPVDDALADISAIHLRRVSVAKAQKDAIEDSLFRLERSALLGLSSSNGEADIRVKEAELVRKFAERARLIDPLGRVVTAHKHQQRNLLLEDGDTIVVPRRTQVVRVSGEVRMAHALVHESGRSAEDYVDAAGGYSDRADEDQLIVLHPDASVQIVDPDHLVSAGDEILVAPRVDTKLLQNTVDVTQIIYQVAVATGVVLSLGL